MASIKEEVEALLTLQPHERKEALHKRAVAYLTTGGDEDGYNLFLLWGLASTDGVKRYLERGGPKWLGRPRGG